MVFSRQFRALLKLAGLWAIPWTALGIGVAIVRWVAGPDLSSTGNSLGGWILNHALAYGALGLISGLYLGLLLARIERGRRVEAITTRRIALWSAIGGAAPPVLFAALGFMFGASSIVLLPLLGLGVLSAVGSSVLATSAHAAATRGLLADRPAPHQFPTT
jgi:hypothetical protein